MNPGEATVRVVADGPRVVVELAGDLDLGTLPRIEPRLREALRDGPREVVADLTAVTFLDSTATAMLFRLAEESRARRRRFVVVAPRESAVRRLLDLVGFEQAATVVDAPP